MHIHSALGDTVVCSVDVPLCDAVARLGDPAGRPTPLPTSDEATLHEKATPTNVVCTGHGTPPLHGSHGLCRQHTSEVPAARAAAVLGAALGGLAATLVVPSERDAAARHASVRNAIHELFNGPDLLDEHTTALRERVLQLQQAAASHAPRASGGSASMPTAVDNFVRKAAPVASLTGVLALRCAEIGTQAALCAARGLSGPHRRHVIACAGRLGDIGLVWVEFVKQLRWHWDTATRLPRMVSALSLGVVLR